MKDRALDQPRSRKREWRRDAGSNDRPRDEARGGVARGSASHPARRVTSERAQAERKAGSRRRDPEGEICEPGEAGCPAHERQAHQREPAQRRPCHIPWRVKPPVA